MKRPTARWTARWVVWGLGMALSACGGSYGMDRGAVPVVEHAQPPAPATPVVDDGQIAEELHRRPQLPARPRVAVYFQPADSTSTLAWRWSFEERQEIVRAGLDRHDVELFAMPASATASSDLRSVRLAAARYGADAVVIVRGTYEQRRRENLWAATYVLVLPILFAPAQEQETVFVAEASMVDVRNGYTYLAAEGEASQSQQRAHVWVRGEEGVDASRRRAVSLLAEELGARLASVRPSLAPPSPSATATVSTSGAPTSAAPPGAAGSE
ncbi:MAG: hypothetical protein IT378_14395 [Sandaracinaceae bacterium]|nr:hypothetical protein [Sandaracinaceae bacterium]